MRATKITAITAAFFFSASLAACGGDEAGSNDTAAAPAATTASAAPSMATDTMASFGAGCAAVPTEATDPGSFDAMSKVPVATAASGNPLLSTLVTAVKQAGLVDTLNTAPALTVFAPTNDAFAKIPAADLKAVLADKETLTSILTYHVVEGKLAPAQLAGTHKTIQGDEVTVEGSGSDFKVNEASVVCGNVQTANATVYIIDSVLMPKG
ncbi:fasciclin domain-containing protein [Actinoplanes auranticolor]|uniref:Lipoprotein n=1 Tax=Actinoplanes auranticolor TaxID=47988 RepID=A0A919VQF3_9ACTN|nr:fasciclin domain-containing protein [Actinoplanes auranticolor]GIM72491.1 lipoprotein [Actinoplanes auranticolor]